MSLKGSAQQQDSTRDKIHQLTNELQVIMEDKKAYAMKGMVAEFTRNNGRSESESSSAEGSAAVGGSPRGAEPLLHEKRLLLLLLLEA